MYIVLVALSDTSVLNVSWPVTPSFGGAGGEIRIFIITIIVLLTYYYRVYLRDAPDYEDYKDELEIFTFKDCGSRNQLAIRVKKLFADTYGRLSKLAETNPLIRQMWNIIYYTIMKSEKVFWYKFCTRSVTSFDCVFAATPLGQDLCYFGRYDLDFVYSNPDDWYLYPTETNFHDLVKKLPKVKRSEPVETRVEMDVWRWNRR